ncbi:MAG: iron ABC transporter permease [Anaerolineaceae bacterium]|nr:iron ABC transporter permease [Anaerolineaceae bacterium]
MSQGIRQVWLARRNWANRRVLLLWSLPLAFLTLFFFYPLFSVFRLGLTTVQAPQPLLTWEQVGRPLGFTLYQALLSMLLTLAVGLPGAYLFARYTFPGKELLRALTTIPFILPTVVVAAAFNALLGPRGWANLALMEAFHLDAPPINFLYTFGAILVAHVFYNTTVVIRTVGNAWARLDGRLGQAAEVLGASRARVFREVTLPLLRPSILAAALLVFLFDFTSFGVILILGGPRFATIEVAIYIQALNLLNLPLAGLLSLVQLLCTLVITGVYSRSIAAAIVPLAPRTQPGSVRRPRGFRQRLLVGSLIAVLAVLLVSPLAALALRSFSRLEANRGQRGEVQAGLTTQYYQALFTNPRESLFYVPPVEAARNSLIYAGATVLLSVSLGFAAAYALNQPAALNRLLDPVLMLPLGTSAVTLGLGFILVFNRPPLDLRASPLLVPLAHTLVALPFVVRSLQPTLGSIPNSLRQAAAVLGASPLRVWREIDLPILARAALASAVFAFTISLGEFGATSFLARPEYPTLPIAIYRFLSQPGALNYGQALAMATLLMVVCGAGILLIERLRLPGEHGK